jgi:hypothetical protein
MMMKGPIREIIQLPGQSARIKLPPGKEAKKVRLLVSGLEPQVRRTSSHISLPLPPIGVHEVVAIDLA